MKSIQVPAIHDELLIAFQNGDFDYMDELEDKVNSIWRSLFDSLVNGDIDGFYYNSKSNSDNYNQYVYTRSVKTDGVQKSCIWYKNEELIPVSDSQYHSYKDMERDGCADNVMVFVFKCNDLL